MLIVREKLNPGVYKYHNNIQSKYNSQGIPSVQGFNTPAWRVTIT